MTNSEFKAWFDGFTEAMGGAPNSKQWERIKTKVKEIDGASITRHYVERYYPAGYPYWGMGASLSCSGPAQASVTNNLAGMQGHNAMNHAGAAQSFDSQSAMYALGRMDASN